ncbi:hypothetical protein Hanom_Chr04g00366281 [Helianthus anomalus]
MSSFFRSEFLLYTILCLLLKLVDVEPVLRGDGRIILNQLKKHYYSFVGSARQLPNTIPPFGFCMYR